MPTTLRELHWCERPGLGQLMDNNNTLYLRDCGWCTNKTTTMYTTQVNRVHTGQLLLWSPKHVQVLFKTIVHIWCEVYITLTCYYIPRKWRVSRLKNQDWRRLLISLNCQRIVASSYSVFTASKLEPPTESPVFQINLTFGRESILYSLYYPEAEARNYQTLRWWWGGKHQEPWPHVNQCCVGKVGQIK